MLNPTALDELHAEYEQLTERQPATLNDGQRRGLLFYLAERRSMSGLPDPLGTPARVTRWTRRRALLEEFISFQGHGPRENNRVPRSALTAEERILAEWVRSQRKSLTAGRLCTYQKVRLDCVSDFSWNPREDAWRRASNEYLAFVTAYRRAPSERSIDRAERALAAWATKCRRIHRRGRMPEHHVVFMEALPIWGWGPTR